MPPEKTTRWQTISAWRVRQPCREAQGHANKLTKDLKAAILAAAEAAGGEGGSVAYLTRLAIENSSAYASLLGKCLPHTLSADESGGGVGMHIHFTREIVWPDGRREVENTPKSLPAPDAPHAPTDRTDDTNEGAV